MGNNFSFPKLHKQASKQTTARVKNPVPLNGYLPLSC